MLTVVPNPAGLAAAITLTATVSVTPPASGTPTGLVRFRANGSVIGSASLAPSGLATMTTSLVIAGSVDLTASYVGDNAFAPSTSPIVPHQTASVAASTVTVISTSPSPSAAGSPLTVLALVLPLAGGTPTGSVQFFDGATPIGTAALATFSGLQVAFVTITPATAGLRTLTARYAGNATFAGSMSPPGVHTVYAGAAPSATTTTLVSAPASSLVGQAVTLTATVTRAAGGIATGTVDFYAYGALLGSQPLATVGTSAQAALTVTSLPKGLAPVSAAYRGTTTAAASATLVPVFQCVDCSAANATPLAEAGPIQAVAPGAIVQLDGTASSDLEGAPLTYSWTNITTAPFQPATLTNGSSARPTFVATAAEAVYAFDLVVSDGTLSSPPDRVYVLSTATYVNARPIAQAGADQFVEAGQGITLNGSASADPDGQPMALTYQWLLRTKPVGSAAELTSTTSPTPSFFLDLEGRYEFELVVFDGATVSAPDRVIVATNHPPIARAGDDQERTVGSVAQLSGAGSTDMDGQRLTYAWTLLSAPAGGGALSSTSAVRPTLPITVAGTYVVQLVVHDGTDASDPDTVTISTADLPPVADPGPAQHDPGSTPTPGPLGEDGVPVSTVAVGQTVRLDATGSWDPNFVLASSLTYQWTLTQRPAGSAAALSSPTSARPTFVADVAGQYVARLVVTSGALSSIPRDIRISTGNSRPLANAGRAQTVTPGTNVRLDATGSTDVNGDPLSYEWSLLSTPAGSAAALVGDTSPRPAFMADLPGVYVAQVVVSDGAFRDAATVLITTGNVEPIGRAGADQAVPVPSSVTLDASASSDENFDPLTYRWLLTQKPAGSSAVLTDATTAAPGLSITVAGDYVAQLRVAEGNRFGTVDTVLVTTGNARPLANAGGDLNAAVGGVVALDGSGSSDANGDPVSYQWAMLYRPAGSGATLSNPAAAEPSFVADVAGTYIVQLIVADTTLRSAADTVTITTVGAPTAVAIAPDTAYTGASVPLDGSASTDPQSLPLAYLWSFGSRPAGSVASIANPLAAMTAFTPDLVGTYVVCLIVSNGAVASAPDCETVMVAAAPSLTLSPGIVNLALNESAMMTVTLNQPAGLSPVEVSLEATGTAAVTVPPTVTVGAGQTSATFMVNAGSSEGPATIAATLGGYVGDLAHVNVSVSGITITLGAGLVLAPQQVRDLSLTLSEPAPAGGVLITLASSNPGVASVTPSVFIPEGADVPMANPQVKGLLYGMTEISAAATDVAGDSEVVAVARSIALTPSTLNIVAGGVGTLLLQASAPAPAGGLGFNVGLGTAGVVATAAVATIMPNQLTTSISLTGAAIGTTTITITPTDAADTSTASASVTVSAAQPINLQNTTVGKDLLTVVSGSLALPAPAGGGLAVTIASADAAKALLSSSIAGPGTPSIVVTVPAGSTQVPPFVVHGLADSGVVVLTASATGLPDAHATVTLTPSGFRLATGNFVTGLFSPNSALTIQSVRLDPVTGLPVEPQTLRPGVSANVAVTSSNPAVGTVQSPVSFTGPASSGVSAFDPLAAGATSVSIGVPAGFSAPATGTHITVTVAAPLTFSPPGLTVGRNLQAPVSLALGSPAPAGNLPVVITSTDPSKVLLSKTVTGAGSATISVTVPAGSSATPVFYVQSLEETGIVPVSAAAANYEPASLPVALVPSGVVFVTSSFTTHPAAADTTLALATAWLESGSLAYVPGSSCDRCQAVRAGYPSFDVTVSSSDNPVGSVPNVATFTGGSSTATTAFDPHTPGSVNLTIVTPTGFSTPANGIQIVATIAPPTATLSASSLVVGKSLQAGNGVSLGEPAPAGNLLVTIQSTDPSRVLLSTTATSPGMDTITLFVPAGQSTSPGFHVHALDESGQVTLNLTAPGYIAGSADVSLRPSGFVFRSGSFATSTLSPDTGLAIQAVWLDAGTLESAADPFCTRCQPLGTGVTAEVAVISTPSAVGTITTSPVTIVATTGSGSTAFHPLSGGTATLAVLAPLGFSTPANFREITATVGNPALSMADVLVGKDLETGLSVTMAAPAEPGGTTVTVVSADPTSVLLSTSPTMAGSPSLTLNVPAGQSQTPTFYVQALVGTGAAQLSATANGFTAATSTVSFRPSGFVFVSGNFITGALSVNTPLTLRSVWLDPVTLNSGSDPFCTRCQPLRGGSGPIGVTVTSSDLSVGTITGPAVFAAGDLTANTAFDPLSNGTSTLSIEAPVNFSASSDFTSIVATVQPSVQLSGGVIGRDLEAVVSGSLTALAPAGNLVVTLQSSDPSRLLLSASPTVPGQASIAVVVAAGSSGFSYYAQALAGTGSADVLATAPGHTDGHATVSFAPSGFILDAGDFTVSPDAANVPLAIRSVRLDPDFLNYIVDASCSSCQPLRPGVGAVVNVTSSDPAVGSIIGSASFSAGVATAQVQFDPHVIGVTTVALDLPPAPFATPSNFQFIEVTVAVPPPSLNVGSITLGKNLQAALSGSLGAAAPAGNLDLTITSADPDKVLLSASPTTVGASSIVLVVAAGSTTIPAFYVQALSDTGVVQLTASASGYVTGHSNVMLWPAGFVLVTSSFTTTVPAAPTPIAVRSVRIDPIFHNYGPDGSCSSCQAVRAGLTVDAAVVSGDTGIGTITVSPLAFTGGDGVKSTAFDGLTTGVVAVSLTAPAGFETPSNFQSINATVTNSFVALPEVLVGKNLQAPVTGSLGDPAPAGNLVVTIVSGDPSKLLLSNSTSVSGTDTITVTVPAGSISMPPFYVQALEGAGEVALNVTAPGYVGSPASVTLRPSGFAFTTSHGWLNVNDDFTTTSFAADVPLAIHAVRLLPGTLNYAFELPFCYSCQLVRPGISASVALTSSNPAAGTITNTPLTFDHTVNGGLSAVFDPVGAGTTTIAIVAPPGFSQPSNRNSLVATVTGPPISLTTASVGKDLQTGASGALGAVAPEGGLPVTITSSDAARLRLAITPTDPGTASIVLTVPAGQTTVPGFYLQALDGSGSVDITATAPGYSAGTAAITLVPSGFVSLSPGDTFATTTVADPVTLSIYSVALSPALMYAETQPVRPGASVQVVVTAADSIGTGVGTIIGSPAEFGANEGVKTVAFDSALPGSSLITVVAPAGFSTPANHRILTATVTAPSMFVGDVFIGKDLQAAIGGTLGAVSPADVSFTITSTDASKVLLATTPTAPGAASIMVTAAGPTGVIPGFYVHGLADAGTVTLNVSSPTFTPTTAQVTLTPSGFIISSPGAMVSTQGNAANTQFQISSVRLAPGTLVYQVAQPLRPGASVSVAVTSSAPSVGTITLSPVLFTANEGLKSTFFDPQPVAADGTTTVSLAAPAGFATPSQFQQVEVTVTAVVVDHNVTSNYAQWALGSTAAPYVADFESFTTGAILTGLEYSASGLTIVQRDGFPMRVAAAGDGSFVLPGNFNSPTRGLTSSFLDDSKSENYDFSFAHTVTSAGLWIGHLNPEGPAVPVQFLDATGAVIQTFTASAADPNLVGAGGPYNTRLFVGLNSTVPIAKIRVVNGVGDNDGIVFDDVVFSRAATTIIDFEDQPDNFGVSVFPSSYKGITWTGFLHYAPIPALYQPGGLNAIYGGADGARFTFPEQVFTGADISRYPGSVDPIYYELYRHGALVWTTTPFPAPGNQLTFYPSGYAGLVDEVRLRSLGDSMTPAGAKWLIDNISFIRSGAAGSLYLTPASSSRAVGSTDPMTVSIVEPLSFDLSVTLASSEPVVASVPGLVVIPAGATSALFSVTGASAGGSVITASSPDASPARAVVAIGSTLVEWISNTSGLWSQGVNWSGGVPPASGDVVYIDRPASNITVTVDVGTAPVRNLFATEVVSIPATLSIQNTAAFDGGVTLTGVLQGAGRATARGLSTWQSGSINLAGGLDIEAGQTLAITSNNDHTASFSALRNHGTVEWNAGLVRLSDGSSGLNDVGALWKVNGDLQMASNGNGTSPFMNAGILRKTSGAGTFTIGGGPVQITNTGTIDIQAGNVANAAAALLNSGQLALAPGTTFQLNNVVLQAGSTFSGSGTLLANGTTTVSAALTIPLPTELTGNISGPGQWTTGAPFTWVSGTVGVTGGLDIGPGQTLTITSNNDHTVSFSALRNHGTVEWNAGLLRLSDGSPGLNDAGALWKVNGDLQMASNGNGTSPFTNAGILRKTSGAGTFTIGGGPVQITNGPTGTIDVQAGNVANAAAALLNSGQLALAPGTTFQLNNVVLQAGSTFSGSGTLLANGTTTVNTALTIALPTELTGNISGPGQWTTGAPFTWVSGIVGLTGGLDIGPGQMLTITSNNDHNVSFSALRNHGTVEWNAGLLRLSDGSPGLNDAGALWKVNGDLQIASNGNGTSPFTNAGILRKTSGAGTFTIGGGPVQITNTAAGTIDVQAGTVANASLPLTTSGRFVVAAGATFQLNNVVLQTDATFSGSGTLLANGATTVTGTVVVTLPLILTGTLTGDGRVFASAPFVWNSGTISLSSGLDIVPGETMTITTANDHNVSGGAIRNLGTTLWNGGVLRVNDGAGVQNQNGGIWEMQGSLQIASNGNGSSTFTNGGTLRWTGAPAVMSMGQVALTLLNSGTVQVRVAGTGDQFDRINLTTITLGGTLDVSLINGFAPAVADQFSVFTYSAKTGTFSTINGNGHSFAACYGTNAFTLGDPANPLFCGGS